jgi:hypothetical protein
MAAFANSWQARRNCTMTGFNPKWCVGCMTEDAMANARAEILTRGRPVG